MSSERYNQFETSGYGKYYTLLSLYRVEVLLCNKNFRKFLLKIINIINIIEANTEYLQKSFEGK